MLYIFEPEKNEVVVLLVVGKKVQRHLTLHFDDVEVFDPADPEGRHRTWAMQWNEQIGRPMSPPTIASP